MKTIKCEICNREQESMFVAENYKGLGWNVCEQCQNSDELLRALSEEIDLRDIEIKILRSRYKEDMYYLHQRAKNILTAEESIMAESRMEIAFIEGYTGGALKRLGVSDGI